LQPTPPPRRGTPLKKVLATLMVLVGVALVGLIVINLTNRSSDVAYQNDDYQVPAPDKNPPALPVPDTESEAKALMTRNKLYEQQMPVPIRCELKPITDSTSDAELQTHLNNLMACLVRAWEPPVSDAGYTIVRPTVTIYGSQIQTKCGKAEGGNAFYCPADQQVYYSRTLPDAISDLKGSPWGPDLVLAHEFGHAVQARTGILVSADAMEQQAGTKTEAGLELSRRIEVQADCFSGLFLRSSSQSLGIRQSDVHAMEVIFVAIGDDTLTGRTDVEGNHGHGSSRLYWARQGIGNDDVKVCNTFTAPSSKVR
jgi:predicted metalloprotease